MPDDVVTFGGPERPHRFERVTAWVERIGGGRSRVAAVAAAVALVIAASVAAAVLSSTPGHRDHSGTSHRRQANPPVYPVAASIRIPLGRVVDMAGDGGYVWAVRFDGSRFQLVKIDARTGALLLRVSLGRDYQAVAAGAGTVWLTSPSSQAHSQLERIDPATGRVVKTVRLPVSSCNADLTFSAGRLLAECRAGSPGSVFLLLNPRTGTVEWRSAVIRNLIGPFVAGPSGVWFMTLAGVSGIVAVGPHGHRVTVTDPPGTRLAGAQDLTYGDGFIWVLAGDGTVFKIDPATGGVVEVFGFAGSEPGRVRALNGFAVGAGSLWLVGGSQLGSVLRVSTASGRPVSIVPSRDIGSCGQPCALIYDLQGAVWVPTATSLIKINDSYRLTNLLHAARRPHPRP